MLEAVAQGLPEAFREAPIACGLVLGSGWGDVLKPEAVHAWVPYAALEGFGSSTVAGHHGELLLLTLGGKRVVAFSGRRHYYEGCDLDQVVYPVELLRCLGAPIVLLTNAAGGLNPDFARPLGAERRGCAPRRLRLLRRPLLRDAGGGAGVADARRRRGGHEHGAGGRCGARGGSARGRAQLRHEPRRGAQSHAVAP